jgi:hypothetical protein
VDDFPQLDFANLELERFLGDSKEIIGAISERNVEAAARPPRRS